MAWRRCGLARSTAPWWAGASLLAGAAACLPSYDIEPGGGGGPGVTSSTSMAAPTSNGSSVSSSNGATAGEGAGGAGGATAGEGAGGAGGAGGGLPPDCAPLEGLVGHWVGDDAAIGRAEDDDVDSWPAAEVGAELTLAQGEVAPTLSSFGTSGHAGVHFRPHAGSKPGSLVPSSLQTSLDTAGIPRDQVTILVVAQMGEDDTAQWVRWGSPQHRTGMTCHNDGAFGIGRAGGGFAFWAEHEADGSPCKLTQMLAPDVDARPLDPLLVVGTRRRVSENPRNYLRVNGKSLYPGGALDRTGGIDLGDGTFRVGSGSLNDHGFDGVIADLLVYGEVLDGLTLRGIESCLAEKYALSFTPTAEPCENDRHDSDHETDVDCGGATCAARCTVGRRCREGTDCETGLCESEGPEGEGPGRSCVAAPVARVVELDGTPLPPEAEPFAAYFDGTASAGVVRVLGHAIVEQVHRTAIYTLEDGSWSGPESLDGLPPLRVQAAFTQYTPIGGRSHAWLYGGLSKSDGVLDDLWFWDGTSWAPPSQPGPSPLRGAGLAFDPDTSELALFGGRQNDDQVEEPLVATWVLPWMKQAPTDAWQAGPDLTWGRFGAGAAFDTVSGGILTAGGSADLESRRYRSGLWESAGGLGGVGADREGHLLLRDPVRRRVVLLGGLPGSSRSPGSAYEWLPSQSADGKPSWVESVAEGGPSGAFGVGTYDEQRNVIIYVEPDVEPRTFEYSVIGSPCGADVDCPTEFCSDGVCCNEACAADEMRCDSEDHPGECVAD